MTRHRWRLRAPTARIAASSLALGLALALAVAPVPGIAAPAAEPSSEPAADAPDDDDDDDDWGTPGPAKPKTDAPGPAKPKARDLGTGRGSAFDIPVADRLDPYGPRADGVPQLSREQVLRYALENPLVQAADAKIDAMKSQLRKANFAWLPIIETVSTLSPGANIACDDLTVANDAGGGLAQNYDEFQFQWCRSAADPNLDLSTVQGYFKQLGRAGVRVSFDADAVFPLFTFGKIRNTKRLARAGVALAKLEKLQAEQETIKLVLQAHTTLLLARESQVILRDAHKVVGDARERVEDDLGGGGADDWDVDVEAKNPDRDPNDLIKVQLAEIEVEQLMREALRAEALALSALWALAGDAAPPGFDVRERTLTPYEIDGGRQSLTDYKSIAIRERPEAHMARAAIEAREAQEKLARANFLPDLGLVVGVGFARSNAVDREMNQLYYQDRFNYSRVTAALALRWRWDFHNRAFDLQKARADLRAQQYQREAAELYLGQDVTLAYEDLVEAEHRIALAHRATELNWQLVVSFQQRDTLGRGDTNELLRALKDWYKKRFEEAEAIHAHNEAVARLARATGTPLIAQSGASDAKDRPQNAAQAKDAP